MVWMMDLFKKRCDHRHPNWNHKTFCHIGCWLNRELGTPAYNNMSESRKAMVMMATLRMCMPLVADAADQSSGDGLVLCSPGDAPRIRRICSLQFTFKPLQASVANIIIVKKKQEKTRASKASASCSDMPVPEMPVPPTADPAIESLGTFNVVSRIVDEGLTDLLAKNINIDEEPQSVEGSTTRFRMFMQIVFSGGCGVLLSTGQMGRAGPEMIKVITFADCCSHAHQYLKHRAEGFLIIRGEAGPMPECSSSRIATAVPSEPPVPAPSPDASPDASPTYDAGEDELEVMKPSDVPRLVKWLEENHRAINLPRSLHFVVCKQ